METAGLMPVILLVIMGSLYLFFFVHNRAWLTAAAYEAAVDGSIEGAKKDGKSLEAAREKCEALGNSGFFGAENLSAQVNGSKKIQVTYDLDTIEGFGNFDWHMRVEGMASAVRPVSWIRKTKAAAEVVKGVIEAK